VRADLIAGPYLMNDRAGALRTFPHGSFTGAARRLLADGFGARFAFSDDTVIDDCELSLALRIPHLAYGDPDQIAALSITGSDVTELVQALDEVPIVVLRQRRPSDKAARAIPNPILCISPSDHAAPNPSCLCGGRSQCEIGHAASKKIKPSSFSHAADPQRPRTVSVSAQVARGRPSRAFQRRQLGPRFPTRGGAHFAADRRTGPVTPALSATLAAILKGEGTVRIASSAARWRWQSRRPSGRQSLFSAKFCPAGLQSVFEEVGA